MYSTRRFGDMRGEEARSSFLRTLGLDVGNLVMPEQVHGSVVRCVTHKHEKKIPGADGLVSSTPGIVLGVLTADCVPVLLKDQKKNVIGVAHAGWKGTLGNIAAAAIVEMTNLGTNPADVAVSVGPHIGGCCYTVPVSRVRQFQKVFGEDPRVAYRERDVWHLDIGYVNVLQLKLAGVLPHHIDAPVVCTSCRSDIFYSYRKDSTESFGEMLSIIRYER